MASPSAFKADTSPFHHHTAIRVHDMEKMLTFYRDTLGLPFIRQAGEQGAPRVVWLHAVQLIRSDHPGQASQGTLDHLAISVLNIDAMVEQVTAQGTPLEAPVAQAEFPELNLHLKNVFFRDPEGNRVELVQWTPLNKG